MKVFVTGGTGLVGSNVIKVARDEYAAEVIASMHHRQPSVPVDYAVERLDVSDVAAVRSVLRKHRPKCVIHCSASVDHRRLERDHETGWRLMVEATRGMAEVCGEIGAKLVFISTDWVFDGLTPPYYENTPPCPKNYYGLLKLAGETIVSSIGIDYAIVRIAAVFGVNWAFPSWVPEERVTGFGTLPNWMLRTLQGGGEIVEWTDHVNVESSPTLATDCADAMMTICVGQHQGIFHCCGRESATRVELGWLVAETFGFDQSRVRAATEAEMDISLLQDEPYLPPRTPLDVSESERRLGRKMMGVKEGLREWKCQMGATVA